MIWSRVLKSSCPMMVSSSVSGRLRSRSRVSPSQPTTPTLLTVVPPAGTPFAGRGRAAAARAVASQRVVATFPLALCSASTCRGTNAPPKASDGKGPTAGAISGPAGAGAGRARSGDTGELKAAQTYARASRPKCPSAVALAHLARGPPSPLTILPAVADRFAIAQVAPHPLEDANEVGTFAAEVSRDLAERGHRVLLLAPSRSPELVRESRRLIRAAREQPETLFDPDGGVRVLGVGELLFNSTRRAINPAPPIDIARTIEDVLSIAPLDFLHVHEPWAPSAGSVALRHSRALNVGSFHQPVERVLSTQVARRFVELFFGRLDARTASYEATAELLNRYFPASYRLLRPGVTPLERGERSGPL